VLPASDLVQRITSNLDAGFLVKVLMAAE